MFSAGLTRVTIRTKVNITWKKIDFFGDQVPARHADDLGRYFNVLQRRIGHDATSSAPYGTVDWQTIPWS